jgi:hypothetical protein
LREFGAWHLYYDTFSFFVILKGGCHHIVELFEIRYYIQMLALTAEQKKKEERKAKKGHQKTPSFISNFSFLISHLPPPPPPYPA